MEICIQLSAGRGPRECDFFLTQVLDIFKEEALAAQITVTIIKQDQNQYHLLSSVICRLVGTDVHRFLTTWKGSLLWICESPFRPFHPRKNWFIELFEITKEDKLTISEDDISYQVMRSSGAGGQHVNKVSSAVRAIHIPTGIMAIAMDSRSQLQNKKIATERLIQKITEKDNKMAGQLIKEQWQNHHEIKRGDPIRVFKGSKFKSR
ncbi:peptide chain release factor H [Sphingobacterium sp. SRCM116780]|uniref:peptide chain release factor H n=1 Tax=Sphingobacterium sp. SRCM116780 TaxID=2907623 RepID=UPI001F1CA157|nr:peptide chain release factor H [Sphingobacterium sp. SRCM116780]UIR54911.1 peptide chain release factor H [Sphingobacterium sp. SRCM116780]